MAVGRFLSWLLLVILLLWRTQNYPPSATIVYGDLYSTLLCVFVEFRSPRVVLFNWKTHPFLFCYFYLFAGISTSTLAMLIFLVDCVVSWFLMMTKLFAVMAVINGSMYDVIDIPQRKHIMTWFRILLQNHGFVIFALAVMQMILLYLKSPLYYVFASMLEVCFLNILIYWAIYPH